MDCFTEERQISRDDEILSLFHPQIPSPCEQQVEPLKAKIQVLNKVISDQQHYILELHRNHGRHLEQIPNAHLGADNLHRGARQTQRSAPVPAASSALALIG